MKTLLFSGYSDDTFQEISSTRWSADNCGSEEPIFALVYSRSRRAGFFAVAKYGLAGTWSLGASPVDDGVPLPWPIRITSHGDREYACAYSPVLEVDAPDDVQILEWREGDDHEDELHATGLGVIEMIMQGWREGGAA